MKPSSALLWSALSLPLCAGAGEPSLEIGGAAIFLRVMDQGRSVSSSRTIALPEKYVAVMLFAPPKGPAATLRVGLRQNPTPQIELKDCWPMAEQNPGTE